MSKPIKETITVVPAQPGFDVVELCNDEFNYIPVVAWAVIVYDGNPSSARAEPVCTDPVHDDDKIIRQPDGSILFPLDRKFAKGQEADALAYAVQRKRTEDAERARRLRLQSDEVQS